MQMRKQLITKTLRTAAVLLIMLSIMFSVIAFNLPKTHGYVKEQDFTVSEKVFRTSVYLYGNDSLKISIIPKSGARRIVIVNISHLNEVKIASLDLNKRRIVLKFIADKPGMYNISIIFPDIDNTTSEHYIKLEAIGGNKNGYELRYIDYSMFFLIIGLVILSMVYYDRLLLYRSSVGKK